MRWFIDGLALHTLQGLGGAEVAEGAHRQAHAFAPLLVRWPSGKVGGLFDGEGGAVLGGTVVDPAPDLTERWVALLVPALLNAVDRVRVEPQAPVPLWLCLPAALVPDEDRKPSGRTHIAQTIVDHLCAKSPVALQPNVLWGGSECMAAALHRMATTAQAERQPSVHPESSGDESEPSVLWLACDTWAQHKRLMTPLFAGRLASTRNPDGLLPSEAAACLVLQRHPTPKSMAEIAGVGHADTGHAAASTGGSSIRGEAERAHRHDPQSSFDRTAWAHALQVALAEAGLGSRDSLSLSHGVGAQRDQLEEMVLTLARASALLGDLDAIGPRSTSAPVSAHSRGPSSLAEALFSTASRFGETGIVDALLGVACASVALANGWVGADAVVHLAASERSRAAFVIRKTQNPSRGSTDDR